VQLKKGKIIIDHGKNRLIACVKDYYNIYNLIDNFEVIFNAVVPESDNGLNIVDVSEPKLHIIADAGISFYLSSFYSTTEGKTSYEGYIKKYQPKLGDVVFDCGAFCGVSTYFFSKAVGDSGKVYAFEPDEKNYSQLLKNIRIHQLDNVIPVKKGIFSKSKKVYFNNEGSIGSAISEFCLWEDELNKNSIQVVSLEDAFREYQLDKLDFIKMDIEGAEVAAILAAKQFLVAHPSHLAIASYHVYEDKKTWELLEPMFKEMGYNCETGYDAHLTTWAWK
jgi:FkbM family methyltransferase